MTTVTQNNMYLYLAIKIYLNNRNDFNDSTSILSYYIEIKIETNI